jgi:hypothetical protein
MSLNAKHTIRIRSCVRLDLTSQHARFRQRFRLSFNKQEAGSCPEQIYRSTLQDALDASETQLPNACSITNEADKVRGQLAIDSGSVVETTNTVRIALNIVYITLYVLH